MELFANTDYISICVDCWDHPYNPYHFLVISGHFITNQDERYNIMLAYELVNFTKNKIFLLKVKSK